nr:asialoglycoprotein receptor 2-like [Pocillopora verrucosa]
MNADLVVIKSQEEMDFIYSLFVKPLQSGSAWIGLNFKGGSFLWIDGTKVAYRNWNIGEPNNFKGVEHCVETLVNSGKWNDIACSVKRPYVCKRAGHLIRPSRFMSAELDNRDHALIDQAFEEYFVANVTECLKRCLSRDKCFSFNYEYFEQYGKSVN